MTSSAELQTLDLVALSICQILRLPEGQRCRKGESCGDVRLSRRTDGISFKGLAF